MTLAMDDAGATWAMPDVSLLTDGRRPAPAFPLPLLGDAWARWVRQEAEAACAPEDYVAAGLLAAAGAVLANVRRPLAGAKWCEPPLLWMGLVADPSSGKSPALDALGDLIRVAEARMAESHEDEERLHERARLIAKAERERWEADVAAAVASDGIAPDMPRAAEEPPRPVRQRLVVADATPAATAEIAAGTPRGLLVQRDELAGWLGGFTRFGGDGQADRAFAIEGFGGRRFVIDRVKHGGRPIIVPHLSVAVLGSIQPERLAGVLSGVDDGLASRFLWTWPSAPPAFRITRDRIDNEDAQHAFARLCCLPLDTSDEGQPIPRRVPLTDDAVNILEQYGEAMVGRVRASSGLLASSRGKGRGHTLRLSAILEFLWWSMTPGAPEPTMISDIAVFRAVRLMRSYFEPMAERVLGDAAMPVPEVNARRILRHLSDHGIVEFNKRTLGREIGGVLRDAKTMDAAVALIEDAGLIRPTFARAGAAPGRQARNYEVSAAVLQPEPDHRPPRPIVPLVPIGSVEGAIGPIGTIGQQGAGAEKPSDGAIGPIGTIGQGGIHPRASARYAHG